MLSLAVALCFGAFQAAVAQRTINLPWTIVEAQISRQLGADIVVGDSVRWDWSTRSGGEMHSVQHLVGMNETAQFNSTVQQPPGEFTYQFMEEGTYITNCVIHPNTMRSTIVVGPAPVEEGGLTTTTVVIIAAIAVVVLLAVGGTCFYCRRSKAKSKSSAKGGKSKSAMSKKSQHREKRTSKTEKLIPSRDNSDEGLTPIETTPLNIEEGIVQKASAPPEPVATASKESDRGEGEADVFDVTSNLSKQITRGSVSRAKTSHAFGPGSTASSRRSTLNRNTLPRQPTVSEGNTVSHSIDTDTFHAGVFAAPTIREDGTQQDVGVSYTNNDTLRSVASLASQPSSPDVLAAAERVMTATEYTTTKRKSGARFTTVPAPMRPSVSSVSPGGAGAAPQRAMTAAEYTETKKRKSGPFTVPRPKRPSEGNTTKKRVSKVFTFLKNETQKSSEEL